MSISTPLPIPVQAGQSHQNVAQMQSILNLPPNILAQVARSKNPAEQGLLFSRSGIEAYLPSMALPPPSPSEEQAFITTSVPKVSHPAIPHLLHAGVFSPHTTGIKAYAQDPIEPFQPVYGSLDEWAALEARSMARNPDDVRAMHHVENQLKTWAKNNQEIEVYQAVSTVRTTAVALAAQAAHTKRSRQNSLTSSGRLGDEFSNSPVDLSGYKEHYKLELAAHAQTYYPQLHREALKEIVKDEQNGDVRQIQKSSAAMASSTSAAEKSRGSSNASNDATKLIRAAAVAALTANMLAAKDMTEAATGTLSSFGVDPQQIGVPAAHLQASSQTQPPLVPAPAPAQAVLLATSAAASIGHSAPAEVTSVIQQVERSHGCTPEARDVLLRYAHQQYSTGADMDLLPLLHMLDKLHPGHCPTLLLLSCVYYGRGTKHRNPMEAKNCFEASIAMNHHILDIDPKYVEAMSNIGTTLRALGRPQEAEKWWRQAIELRPLYFDSVENLLGVLCNPAAVTNAEGQTEARYFEALEVCNLVEEKAFGAATNIRPYSLPLGIPAAHFSRLQNLFYARGNLYTALKRPLDAKADYEKGIEIMLSSKQSRRPEDAYSVPDLILALILISLTIMARQDQYSPNSQRFANLMTHIQFDPFGSSSIDFLQTAKRRGPEFLPGLLTMGGGFLPLTLLIPQYIHHVAGMLFPSQGILPSIASISSRGFQEDARRGALDLCNQTTSTLLLTLAKIIQDAINSPQGPLATELARTGLPPSVAIVLPLYYLALALHPSPSTYNNLGILLSTINATIVAPTAQGTRTLTGQLLAMEFYKAGLERDATHPHLYTNLGSLLKDMGHLPMAVQMYEKAVEFNPTFDVALANLANAIKDMGHVQDSVPWYYKAVQANPNFPEAVCGLVNALSGVCDWKDRGSVAGELAVGPSNELLNLASPEDQIKASRGWMPKVVGLVNKQLVEGRTFGAGIINLSGGPEAWLNVIAQGLGIDFQQHPKLHKQFYAQLAKIASVGLQPSWINEGGFIIRLIERLMRRTQHRWYVDLYGRATTTVSQQPRASVSEDIAAAYQRPLLPGALPQPPVPTVLPFHTFTLPLDARQTRLICHRNALRLSHQTLTQPWIPHHVFPPPTPPSPRLRIGYVSSDFNNHPLAHLMQSVFGMHDKQVFDVFLYATTSSDQSEYRHKIEREAQHFIDISGLNIQQSVERILMDDIHILVNMNGYTKGARNEIFAARPCPVQVQQLMGFAGTLASGWADWVIADPIIIPKEIVSSEIWHNRSALKQDVGITAFPSDLDPEEESQEWVFTERMVYFPDTYFITDHKQGFRDETMPSATSPEHAWRVEEDRRRLMRQELFPSLPESTVIFCCLNQLYKIDPLIFRVWLNILVQVPKSVLWLLRFPAAGEQHLLNTAELWTSTEVAKRIIFTDVAPKQVHIARGRIADLFLDTIEVGGHTTSADVLWAGTPILTFPRHKHKLCSRVAASIAYSTGFGDQMVVNSIEEYEDRAVRYAKGLLFNSGTWHGELYQLRKNLFLSRDRSPLFDTLKWTRNVEAAYREMWKRWVEGTDFQDYDTLDDTQQQQPDTIQIR